MVTNLLQFTFIGLCSLLQQSWSPTKTPADKTNYNYLQKTTYVTVLVNGLTNNILIRIY